jgi:hypothetical protein
MKNSNDNIGNRTRDLPACSAMPQTTEFYYLIPEKELGEKAQIIRTVRIKMALLEFMFNCILIFIIFCDNSAIKSSKSIINSQSSFLFKRL